MSLSNIFALHGSIEAINGPFGLLSTTVRLQQRADTQGYRFAHVQAVNSAGIFLQES